MQVNLTAGLDHNPKKVIEEIMIKKILRNLPDAAIYQKLIKFIHTGKKVSLDVTRLPAFMARNIEDLLE